MEGTTVSSAPADSGPRDLVRSAPTRGRRFRSLVQRPSTLGAVAVIAVAAPLRAVAVGFALPVLNHPDEPLNVRIGSDMSDQSDWNPHHFNYPSMLYDVVAIFVRIHGWATGQHGSGSARIHIQNIGIAATSEPGLFVALRLLTSVLSVAICLLAYVVVLRVTGRVLAALLAGLLLAVSPTVLTNGVLISPDTYSGVFSALALLGAVAVIRRGRPLDYAVAGIGVGLAAAAKYNAAVRAAQTEHAQDSTGEQQDVRAERDQVVPQ